MQLSIFFLLIILICFSILIIIRKYYIKNLLRLKTEKNFDEYFQRLNSSIANVLIPKIVKNNMILNGYKDLNDLEKIDHTIDEMLQMNMNDLQKEDFYFQQCHYYILRKDQAYIDIFLKRLDELENKKYLIIAQYAYEVIVNKRNDLIKEVDYEIDFLKGINLGIACYLIGLQYLRLEDQAQAKLYFQSAVIVTKYSIYDGLTKHYLHELKDVKAAQADV